MVKQRGCQKLLAGELTRRQIRLVSARGYAPALDRRVVCPPAREGRWVLSDLRPSSWSETKPSHSHPESIVSF
jgi:hypothetical protein